MMLAEPEDNKSVICHQLKVRKDNEFYKVIICGNRYLAEKYLRKELGISSIEWQRTFVMDKDIAFEYSQKNKTIARDTFFIRMEFVCEFGTIRNNPLKNKDDNENQEQKEGT